MCRCLDVHDQLAGMGALPVRHTGPLPTCLTHGALGHGFSDADVPRTTRRLWFTGSIMLKLEQQINDLWCYCHRRAGHCTLPSPSSAVAKYSNH